MAASLVLGAIASAAPAFAQSAEEPVVVSPAASGVELDQAIDGSWFWQVTLDVPEAYIGSWERDLGVWGSPEEAQAAAGQSRECVQGAMKGFLDQFATHAEFELANESLDQDSWSTSTIDDEVRACRDASEWKVERASIDNAGYRVIDIPLDVVGPGTHELFVIGLSTPASGNPTVRNPGCALKVWEGGKWAGGGCPYDASAPVYFTVTVPSPPASEMLLQSRDVEKGSAFDPSVFSTLKPLDQTEDAEALALHVGLTVALALVLAILIALPTEMLNSVVSDKHSRIAGFFRWLLPAGRRAKRSGARPVDDIVADRKRPLVVQRIFGGVSGWWSVPVLVAGAVIASFAEPDFGVNWMSLRLILTLFVAFLIVNLGGTFFAWLVTRRRTGAERPRLTARPLFLVLILVTVLFAKFLHVEPALIFGTVLAIDFGSRLSKARSAAVTTVGAAYLIVIGLGAWVGYSALVGSTLKSAFGLSGIPDAFILPISGALYDARLALGELASVLVVEAISTVPIALLPLAFLSGASLWAWKRWVWALVYAAGLAVYSFVLVPMPKSWETVPEPLMLWIAIFAGYAAFALAVWAVFYFINKRQPEPESENGPALPPVRGPVSDEPVLSRVG
ncbi:hypothetical protein E3T33_11330 [Cryobacterium sp. TMT1-2-1]|uniref:hypothetical protein n=1 Tax=Cryobacterium sp. TMT1-2-1 TaxID=1259232 RepID=UPI00106CFD16|nr:hypothetical protein [Cryobacterium sp. TMT1-2-1]TFD42928.1 hypothetical protein E3T33_11330 [Cryobacterium sp. TMT1-2-1]